MQQQLLGGPGGRAPVGGHRPDLGLLSDGAYAVAASTGAGWLRRRPGVARASRLVSGGVLISLGVTTALAGSRSSSSQ